MIAFKNVSKIYPPNSTALENVSFEIKQGEFVLLVGKSGAGKTTILKLINREEIPSRGKIFYKNVDYQNLRGMDVTKLRRHVTTIFQDFKVLGDRSVFENINLAFDILGRSMREARKKTEEMLKLVDLNHHSPVLAKYLSGGEKQRLAIARAVAMEPEIILADEPTGNLDPINAKIIVDLLMKINEQGASIILATHNREVVDYLKKRVIIVGGGRIIKDETPGRFTLA
ncbi:MAG: ATP-binding cassette domain-containing protein [Patescibacteria group bacterium]|nr:ATP-binding cassette domain-containing protein [Patescibacteria group bacterium]MCL5257639.1 ATP-binding cassette domain-containing protein [Patescibacteria group bacterium]